MGTKDDGSDSVAVEVAPASHWPEIRAVIIVASAKQKKVSSTAGMQTTVATSELFEVRAKKIVPRRMKEMEKAIKERDFNAFGDITMKESDNFHAVCRDTSPSIEYMK